MDFARAELEDILERHEGLEHLHVKKRGESLTICSGSSKDVHKHAKLTALGGGVWGLSLPTHTGRWNRVPVMGTIEEITTTLIQDFGWVLDDVQQHFQQKPR